MMRIILWLLLSSLLTIQASAQFVNEWSLDAIRVGFDPIRTPSMLFDLNKHKDRPVYFNYADVYLELLLHLRTSAVIEAGYTNVNFNLYNNTFFYHNRGRFIRAGFDFNLTEPNPNYEVDLGWRLGMNAFQQDARLALHGNYWNTDINQVTLNNNGNTYWGEILLDMKYRIFKKSENLFFSNLWFDMSIRLKFKQKDLKATTYDQNYYLPGFGFNNKFMPGLSFTLSYFVKFRERKQYRIHHTYDSKVLIHSR